MKYVIYIRVSRDQQVRSGLGMEAQRDICMKYVIANPCHEEVLEFVDEGLSGGREMEKRPALHEAINCLKKDDILLIAKRDRIGRDPIVNAMIERALEKKKARMINVGGDTKDDNDPASILMRRMIDSFAEYEILIIGERTRAALQVKKRRNERLGYIPYGYQLASDGLHLEKNEQEWENLKLIKQLRDEGYSLRYIRDELNYLKRFNRKGPWNQNSVNRVSVGKIIN